MTNNEYLIGQRHFSRIVPCFQDPKTRDNSPKVALSN